MTTTVEIFRNIPLDGYENFQVSTCGNIRNIKTNNMLASHPDKDGYCVLTLRICGKKKQVKLHRLVGITFIDNPLGKPCINHKDGVKTNNFVGNLEWATVEENAAHASKYNLIPKGEQKYNCKLTEHAVLLIKEALRRGETVISIATDFGVGLSTIGSIKIGRNWKHVELPELC